MTRYQFNALMEYIDAKCREASHNAIHRSGSTLMSRNALEVLESSGIIDDHGSDTD